MAAIFRNRFLLVLALCALLSACSASRNVVDRSARATEYCAPTNDYPQEQRAFWVDREPADLKPLGLDAHSQHMCTILGITGAVDRLQRSNGEDPMADMVLRAHIRDRIALAQAQVLAVAAETTCEAARAESFADELDVVNDRRNTRLTVASVAVGALATMATVALHDGNAETVAGVGGGLLSIGLGALTISPKGRAQDFRHERNLLSAVWRNDLSIPGYPYVVEQLLNDPMLSNSGTHTLAGSLRERWKASIFVDQDPALENLLFGSGGSYRADELHIRAELFEQLGATINGLHQDLASLLGTLIVR